MNFSKISNGKMKGLFLLIMGGITGVFLSVAGSLIFAAVMFAAAQAMPWISRLFLLPMWMINRGFSAFIILVAVGFIVGVIKRHSIIIKKLTPSAFIIGIPMMFCLWMVHNYAVRVSVPHEIKLVDCTNSVSNFQFQIPQGHGYFISLITPAVQAKPNGDIISAYQFTGSIHISTGGRLVADFPISSDKSWLTASGFVLTGLGSSNTNVPPLSQFVQAQKKYDFEIILDPPPPPATSIWLYWSQSRIDTQK